MVPLAPLSCARRSVHFLMNNQTPTNPSQVATTEPAPVNAGSNVGAYVEADVGIAAYIVRPLFILVTVILLVGAIGQLGGRILFANLERLEPRLNATLSEHGIAIKGLSGDWRFFDPILRVESLTGPGVQLGATWAEVDTLESLARNRVVFHNAAAERVRLALVQDEAGVWTLEGRKPIENNFDWLSLLWHSDQLELEASVALRGFGVSPSELTLNLNFSNFGGRHRGVLKLADVDGCVSCDLTAEYNVEEAALWFRERQGGAVLRSENFELRDSMAALVGIEYLKLGKLESRLRLQGERFSGPLSLLESEVRLPGGRTSGLSLLADGWSIDDGSAAALQISALQLSGADSVLEVRDALLNWNGSDANASTNASTDTSSAPGTVTFMVPQLNVGDITAVVGNMLPQEVPTARWIRRLGMTGTFTHMLGSWSQERGIGYGGDFHDVFMQSVGGVPSVAELEGSFAGGPSYLQLRLLGADARVGFPQLYREEKDYSSVTGQILMYFGQDYFGLQGSNLHLVDSHLDARGGFSLVSTIPKTNNHITLAIESNAGQFSDIEPYVPYKLPRKVLDWLESSGLRADLSSPRFVMHGPLREEESDMKRSYLVEAEMHDGELVFNKEWPRITDADGLVHVSHESINAELGSAVLAGMALQDMKIWLPAGAAHVVAEGRASFDAATGLEFIRTTPLRESMDFIAADWWADGQMQLDLTLDLPLDDRAGGELDPRVRMQAQGKLQGTTFGMPEAGLQFDDLRGDLNYGYPYNLTGTNIKGTLFGRAMQMGISSTRLTAPPAGAPERFAPRRLDFDLSGEMHSDDMWPLIGLDKSPVVDGLFDFGAVYSTETDTGVLPSLVVETELQGAQINLPAPLGKQADERALTVVSVSFGDTRQRANLLYRGLLDADLGIADEGISGGHMRLLGASGAAADWDGVNGPIRIDGYIASADIAQWAGGESSVELPPYEIADLAIGVATLGKVQLPNMTLSGSSDDSRLQLDFASEFATGSLLVPEVELTELVLSEFIYESPDYVPTAEPVASDGTLVAAKEAQNLEQEPQVTAANEPIIDPIDPAMMDTLPDMQVRIDALRVDGEDYGRWAFRIAREDEGVAFNELNAQVKNLALTAPDGVRWIRADNRTTFAGTLVAEDMGDVLEAWGYARSIASESMETQLDVSWVGSPLNFELLQTRGDAEVTVREGRFLDVTSGNNALRIFSLLNFNAIAKRMSLNFKDVFGRGISFEKVHSLTALDDGTLTFVQPLKVDGTGGDFKVNGRIDMANGQLDNEMVVTLPVNKSLPWLGAYLALANPVVGIGVLLGERILRKPIKELSSAKYRITGNMDDPKLELVSVFDRSMENTVADDELLADDELRASDELLDDDVVVDSVEADLPAAAPPPAANPDVPESGLPEPILPESPVPAPIELDPGAEVLLGIDSPERRTQAKLTMYP